MKLISRNSSVVDFPKAHQMGKSKWSMQTDMTLKLARDSEFNARLIGLTLSSLCYLGKLDCFLLA